MILFVIPFLFMMKSYLLMPAVNKLSVPSDKFDMDVWRLYGDRRGNCLLLDFISLPGAFIRTLI